MSNVDEVIEDINKIEFSLTYLEIYSVWPRGTSVGALRCSVYVLHSARINVVGK